MCASYATLSANLLLSDTKLRDCDASSLLPRSERFLCSEMGHIYGLGRSAIYNHSTWRKPPT
jgi:hypothetical protein